MRTENIFYFFKYLLETHRATEGVTETIKKNYLTFEEQKEALSSKKGKSKVRTP